ncbi:T4 RnlA family RNA ligase [Candidatus Dojkabacteria bacterium]|jgi:T4 RnlA family RNA ligase|nr:T4 RnlA family RNA ligase [Candidatus Dojkabacteria bacterium]
MNEWQQTLYDNLRVLVDTNNAFFCLTTKRDDSIYKIYNYRLASYTDFLAPGAIEARGVMFEVDENGEAIRLASLPMNKFWNLGENPLTTNLDLEDIDSISTKSDGSLISTYLHHGELYLKSKGALFSTQAIDAMEWLNQPEHGAFKRTLQFYAESEYTVNLEWVGPSNRVVLGYTEPNLIVLNVRSFNNGHYAKEFAEVLVRHMSPPVDLLGLQPSGFVAQVPDMLDDIEGFVVKLKSGVWFKIKTLKYKKLHSCKDSITNPRGLYEAIVTEGLDDLLSLFADDKLLIKQITVEQIRVNQEYNQMASTVECFYNTNKHLDRKDYAILCRERVDGRYFSLAMNLYLGKPANYKEYMLKHYDMFSSSTQPLLIEP